MSTTAGRDGERGMLIIVLLLLLLLVGRRLAALT